MCGVTLRDSDNMMVQKKPLYAVTTEKQRFGSASARYIAWGSPFW